MILLTRALKTLYTQMDFLINRTILKVQKQAETINSKTFLQKILIWINRFIILNVIFPNLKIILLLVNSVRTQTDIRVQN